ncbi:PRD domain-containing protein [Arcanobacterium phocisimile]|uniref:PRD domain-containing protein n=1 Tax=Arcanobacterium phocisimile TaxID=1302235 RepID=A0ABX7IFI3_9ACTO|nr:PRD domain-containing protein [Arcanobacterium phocisimile]QRV01901.1 PRD domain-containing protein [Arcanobacterium phocisimile]
MEILRIFNNNVVLARQDSGREVIVTGRGVGFKAQAGQHLNPELIVRVFVPLDGRDPDHLGTLIAQLSGNVRELVHRAMVDAGFSEDQLSSPTLYIALCDHIELALRRAETGEILQYPLQAEVEHLYHDEYIQAGAFLAALNGLLVADSLTPLPMHESIAVALHLVNAGFSAGDLAHTYTMTGLIQQVIDVIGASFGVALDQTSVNTARLITHMRYLFVRITQGKQLDDEISTIGQAIRSSLVDEYACAENISQLISLRLGTELNENETAYLAMHISRVTSPKA